MKQEEGREYESCLIWKKSEGNVFWETARWREGERERERADRRERGERNQSTSHYLLSGALQQRDEIIKNPIAALWEGMTQRREIHIWTGESNRSPFWHVDTLTLEQTLTAASDPHILKEKVWVQQSRGGKSEGRWGRMRSEWSVNSGEAMWHRKRGWERKQSAVTKWLGRSAEAIYRIISGGLSSWPLGVAEEVQQRLVYTH